MKFQRGVVYDDPELFFSYGGSSVMTLTPAAAIAVCRMAFDRGFLVVRVEGGIRRGSYIETRLDCIWDGHNPPLSAEESIDQNERAAKDVIYESAIHDAFRIQVGPLTGWPWKNRSP